MKRGGRLERRTPLRSGKGIGRRDRTAPEITEEVLVERARIDLTAAAAALQNQIRSAEAPREHRPVADPVKPAAKRKDTGFPAVVRQTILDRDHMRCQRCGRAIDADEWLGYSLQHRDNRGMGGTDDPRVNWTSNGITLCGSATTGCHGWVEEHPIEAEQHGFAVQSWADPETVPVLTYRGWVLLDRRGAAHPTSCPANGDAHGGAQRLTPYKNGPLL